MQLIELTELPLELCGMIGEYVPPTEALPYAHILNGIYYDASSGNLLSHDVHGVRDVRDVRDAALGRRVPRWQVPAMITDAVFYGKFVAIAMCDARVELLQIDGREFRFVHGFDASGGIEDLHMSSHEVTYICDGCPVSYTVLGPYIKWRSHWERPSIKYVTPSGETNVLYADQRMYSPARDAVGLRPYHVMVSEKIVWQGPIPYTFCSKVFIVHGDDSWFVVFAHIKMCLSSSFKSPARWCAV
jgi:hypothetical protein